MSPEMFLTLTMLLAIFLVATCWRAYRSYKRFSAELDERERALVELYARRNGHLPTRPEDTVHER